MYYFFKDTLKLNLAQLIFYNSILNFIWVLKPLFGFTCDSYKLFGSHRKSYLILASLVNMVGWVLMATCVTNLWQAMLTKTLINVAVSFENVVGEAIMVQTSKSKG
jgi:MFS family permease